MNDEQSEELEALSAIMGEDMWADASPLDGLAFYVKPECDEETETVSAVVLSVALPEAYPAASASFAVSSLSNPVWQSRFPHQAHSSASSPAQEQADLLQAVAATAAAEQPSGEPVLWAVVEAVRQWLETHTLEAKPPPEPDAGVTGVQEQLGGAEISEDDLELDEEDMDEELVEAVREVLRPGGQDRALERKLDMAAAMKSGSREQRAALKEVWLALTPAQRRQMVASDSEGDDEDDEEEAAAAAVAPPPSRGGAVGRKKPAAPTAALPPPAQRTCARGHALTPGNAKPADYKKLDGDEGNCDVCGKDFFYRQGGYHCASCRNWDCCVACGGTVASAAKGKNQKGRRR